METDCCMQRVEEELQPRERALLYPLASGLSGGGGVGRHSWQLGRPEGRGGPLLRRGPSGLGSWPPGSFENAACDVGIFTNSSRELSIISIAAMSSSCLERLDVSSFSS